LNATIDLDASQQEYEQLSSRLATRRSTGQFARTAYGLVTAVVVAGTAGKLFWDTATKYLWIPVLPTLLTLGLVIYSVRRYLNGKRELARELAEYEKLQALRQSLKLDDPDALLPR